MAAERRCVIVAASPEYDIGFIRSSVMPEDYIICADGGADILSAAGIEPDLIVGDFDSSKEKDLFPNTERIVLSTHKDDTDTMHCTAVGLERGFRCFLYLAATGGRTDHALANLSVLIYLSNNDAHGIISDKYNDIVLLDRGRNIIHTKKGSVISVLPFGSASAELSYEGLLYPLEKGTVTINFPYTISNEACEDTVSVTLHSGSALLFTVY